MNLLNVVANAGNPAQYNFKVENKMKTLSFTVSSSAQSFVDELNLKVVLKREDKADFVIYPEMSIKHLIEHSLLVGGAVTSTKEGTIFDIPVAVGGSLDLNPDNFLDVTLTGCKDNMSFVIDGEKTKQTTMTVYSAELKDLTVSNSKPLKTRGYLHMLTDFRDTNEMTITSTRGVKKFVEKELRKNVALRRAYQVPMLQTLLKLRWENVVFSAKGSQVSVSHVDMVVVKERQISLFKLEQLKR